ncbi:MAG: hypothetical protein U5J95_09470 [Balneolaceae bacterium]|nr:hypothetical protein [Balneolaceae bacterium]
MDRSISRKGFLKSATVLGMGSMLWSMPEIEQNTIHQPNPDLVLDPNEGEVYLIGERQGRITIKVDKQNKGIETMSLPYRRYQARRRDTGTQALFRRRAYFY